MARQRPGVRHSSGAFDGGLPFRKGQRTGALQDLTACRRSCQLSLLLTWSLVGVTAPVGSNTAFAEEVDESKLPPPAARKVDYQSDIKPILQQNCYKCHSD